MTNHRILVPVRYSAWLAGDLGRRLEADMCNALPECAITRLPRGFLIEGPAPSIGALLDQAAEACIALEASTAERYPIFHKEMGPVYTGTIQAILAGA